MAAIFAFFFLFPFGAWWIATYVCLAIVILAIPAYLLRTAGNAVGDRIVRRLDERDERRRPTLGP